MIRAPEIAHIIRDAACAEDAANTIAAKLEEITAMIITKPGEWAQISTGASGGLRALHSTPELIARSIGWEPKP